MTINNKITINGIQVFPDSCIVKKKLGDINSSSTFNLKINNYKGDIRLDLMTVKFGHGRPELTNFKGISAG